MEDMLALIGDCDIEGVRELIRAGRPVDMLTDDGRSQTLLHQAVTAECAEIVELMLQQGVPVNARDEDEETALHVAAQSGRCDIALLLLQNGADVNAMGRWWEGTPLHVAVEFDRLDLTRLLLEHDADVNAISEDGSYGIPLHHAASRQVAECLIAHGADIDAQDSYGHTPLHEAASDGNLDVASALVAHGADTGAHSHSGWTPLHWAVWNRHQPIVRLLLSAGVDANVRVLAENGMTGWTPMCWSKPGPLKDAGKKPVLSGWTPLHLAAIRGHAGIAGDLLNRGADPNAVADSLCTPLHWARLMGKPKVAAILTSHGGKDICA